jgi:hypothetical protein
VKDGGAAVKFVTGEPNELQNVSAKLQSAAASGGFLFATVDARTTKAHQMDHVFHAIARQIDWMALARNVAERAIVERGYAIPASGELTFAAIAEETGSTTFLVRNELHQWFSKEVFRDYQMTQEFRLAMMRLALDPMEHSNGGTGGLTDLLIEWLRGELRLVSALRDALIFQKILRHNARDTFVSLTHWLRVAGFPGMLVVADVAPYMVASRNLADGNYYTRAAAADLYEVLRQFVDATDELQGCALVVLAPSGWAEDEGRGLRMYRALAARVSEEARGRQHDNPVAVLARVGG